MLTPENDEEYQVDVDFYCDDCHYFDTLTLEARGNRGSDTAYWQTNCPACDVYVEGEINREDSTDQSDYLYEMARDAALEWA